jgi:cell division septation protein DedD
MTVKFLCELIENKTRVILPDFGAFLVKEDGSGVFKPKNVTFSPFLRINDGMLENALVQEKNIGKDQAKNSIDSFIETIKNELLEHNTFHLENLGSLYRDHRGTVLFRASEIDEKIAATKTEVKKPIGKEPIAAKKEKVVKDKVPTPAAENEPKTSVPESKPIEEKPAEEPKISQDIKVEKVEAVNEPIAVPEAIKSPPTSKPHKPPIKPKPPVKAKPEPTPKVHNEPMGESTGIGKAILIGVLIAILVVAIGVGWILVNKGHIKLKRERVEKSIVIPTQTDTEKTDVSTDFVDEKVGKFDDDFKKLSSEMEKSSQKDETKESAQVIIDSKIPPSTTSVDQKAGTAYPQEGTFHLVVGSFRNPEYAEKFSDDLKRSGYNSRVVIRSSGMHSVTVGSFPTQAEALEAMNEVKQQHPNVWLLKE